MTLSEIVSDYIREYREHARAEMRFFEIQRSPSMVIRTAGLCELPSGKRHPHQRRIPGNCWKKWKHNSRQSGGNSPKHLTSPTSV